jgi:hypothetical protein
MPLLVSAIVRLTDFSDSCPRNFPGCYGCYDSESGADDKRGESLLLEGLSGVADLSYQSILKSYALLICTLLQANN